MPVRPNAARQILKSGGTIYSSSIRLPEPGLCELLGYAGFDFVLIDDEHGATDAVAIDRLVQGCFAGDTVPVVRVLRNDEPEAVMKALDLGAQGVLIPHCRTAADALRLQQAAWYPPRGKRGCAFVMPHDEYKSGDQAEVIRRANENLLVVAQIETAEGLDNVDAIAAVDGVDALWIGQYDLTTALGIPGQFTHPKFTEAVKRVVGACHKHGKVATLAGLDVAELAAGPANGFRMLVYLADLWIYQQALRRCFGTIRDRLPKS